MLYNLYVITFCFLMVLIIHSEILIAVSVPGPGLWAWERVHPGTQRSEPGGSGPRTLRPGVHRHRLHLRGRRERRARVVAESLRGDCQGGGGARTGHRHHPRLWPRLASNQARPRSLEDCSTVNGGDDDHVTPPPLLPLGRYSLQGDTKKYFSIGKYSGELKTVQALDREENSTYTMKVIAVDGSERRLASLWRLMLRALCFHCFRQIRGMLKVPWLRENCTCFYFVSKLFLFPLEWPSSPLWCHKGHWLRAVYHLLSHFKGWGRGRGRTWFEEPSKNSCTSTVLLCGLSLDTCWSWSQNTDNSTGSTRL